MDTVAQVVQAGAEILVAGNAVFGKGDARANAAALLDAARSASLQKCRQGQRLEVRLQRLNLYASKFYFVVLGLLLALTVGCTNKKSSTLWRTLVEAAGQGAVRPGHGCDSTTASTWRG